MRPNIVCLINAKYAYSGVGSALYENCFLENKDRATANSFVQLFNEEMMRDIQKADPEWRIVLLRYFNPVGSHPSGDIGEDPLGIPNNLMPFVQQVAVGRREELTVFGKDYNTADGTGVSIIFQLMCLCD